MPKTQMYKIDPAKLSRLLKIARVTPTEAASGCGYGEDQVRTVLREQRVSRIFAKKLEEVYHIELRDYTIDAIPEDLHTIEIIKKALENARWKA